MSVRLLRIYLHSPELQKIPIGNISSFGDLVRVSFDENYVNQTNRLSLSNRAENLAVQGEDE